MEQSGSHVGFAPSSRPFSMSGDFPKSSFIK